MPATIKLMRIGKKGHPSYRIVVVDKRKKRNTAYIEEIGFYNPMTDPATLKINQDKLKSWLQKGATLTDGARKLHLKGV